MIAALLLILPTAWHLYQDRNGDPKEEKLIDILIVVCLAIFAAVAGYLIADKPILDSLLLAWGFHFLVFDYLIVIILKGRRVIETKESWYSYLGESYTDDVLRQFHPHLRFGIKLVIFIAAVTVYVL